MATISPARMSRLMSASTVIVPSPAGKSRCNPRSSSSAGASAVAGVAGVKASAFKTGCAVLAAARSGYRARALH